MTNGFGRSSWGRKGVKLDFIDAEAAAETVAEHFLEEGATFNIIPDTRTNRIFLMGTIEQIEQAEGMLRKLDVAEAL